MPDRIRYTICLSSSDIDLINYVENKKKTLSISVYVRELIRRDMEGKLQPDDLEQIYKYVLERLRHEGCLSQLSDGKEAVIDAMDQEIIMNLF